MKILVVDDERKNAELVAAELAEAGHATAYVTSSAEALQSLAASPVDAVITDLRMAPPDGLALLAEVRQRWPETLVYLMTAYSELETARKALKLGAADYVEKEGDYVEVLARALAEAGERRQLRHENARLEREVSALSAAAAPVVGDSPAVRHVLDLARKVARTDSTVLLRGESGTGKDLFARTIHLASPRATGPWVKVNCGALPEPLLESELFGHEKGAFTGAIKQKRGRFEDADHGTIFLDEIGEVPPALQVKLLQVLEERTFMRVGGNLPVRADVRIVAATNRPLEDMVKERTFREDLFFRLNVFPITLPPLRERPGDVARLAASVLERHGASPDRLTEAAQRALAGYPFPGNVRELEHTLERALILAGGEPITPEHLSFARPELSGRAAASWVPRIPEEGLSLEQLEKELILQALDRAAGNKSRAARLLGLTRRTLYSRMEKHGLHVPANELAEADTD